MQMLFGADRLAFIVVIRFVVELLFENMLDSRLGNRL